MFDHLRLETLVGLGAASVLAYVLWGPRTAKARSANAAGALAGLQNVGNSCFLNAVLQALASSAAVVRWLESPAGAGTSSRHRQLRAALVDVIRVVNRTHRELRADPFTPAGVIACLSRLGWLIRSEEQDTHEMFYVLISTLQEEPPPLPALSADGLCDGDGPVEGDTGEPLVDWGGIGARMRNDVSDICDSGGNFTGSSTVGLDTDGDTGERVYESALVGSDTNGALDGCTAAAAGSHLVQQDGSESGPDAGSAPDRENGSATGAQTNGNVPGIARLSDGGDEPRDFDAAGDASRQVKPSGNAARDSGGAQKPSGSIAVPNGVGTEAVLKSPAPEAGAASLAPTAAESVAPSTCAESSPPSAARGDPAVAAAAGDCTGSTAATSAPAGRAGLAVSLPSAGVGRCSPLVAGAAGRRRRRGILHRVPSSDAGPLDWRVPTGHTRSAFTGTVSTQLVCQSCGHKCAVRWENFESLSLPLPAAPRPQPLSLPTLLSHFSARETVHDVTCDTCRRRVRFSKRTLVAKLPAALCLHLPRTTWQGNGQAGKRGDHVSFSETLNMFPYTYSTNATAASVGRPVSPPVDSGRHMYRLTAVIVHTGAASTGHFVTYRRMLDTSDNRWFYTSDTMVSRASASEVLASPAYMLFYDRVTPAAPSLPVPAAARSASPVAAALLSPVAPAMLSPRSPAAELGPPVWGHR